MRITSYSELRRNLAAAIDAVNADHEPLLITRDRGKPTAVLISLEDFASYEETEFLLRDPKNAQRLHESIADLEAGRGLAKTLIE
ncbi:MAG: type II toxin-antitoxin system Phd/YefM family antitoxin [Roseiarcus sp.]